MSFLTVRLLSFFDFFFFFFFSSLLTATFAQYQLRPSPLPTLNLESKIEAMTLKELALLIKYHGVLGNLSALKALEEQGVDLTATCPMTRQNLLHIAIMMDNTELLLFGLQFPQLLDLEHSKGKTPRTQLETIAKNSACNRAFIAIPKAAGAGLPTIPFSLF